MGALPSNLNLAGEYPPARSPSAGGGARRTNRVANSAIAAFCAAVVLIVGFPPVAVAANAPGHSIATAPPLTFGDLQSGGGQQTDFWKVALQGGDRVVIDGTYPAESAYSPGGFMQTDLFAPSVTDFTYFQSSPVEQREGLWGQHETVLQAPATGDFTLAVCEGSESGCSNPDQFSIDATVPMDPYTFTASLERPVLVRRCSTRRVRRHHHLRLVRSCKTHTSWPNVTSARVAGLL